MFTKRFALAALERAVVAAAATASSVIGGGVVNAFHVGWLDVSGAALGSAVVSLLASLAMAGAAAGGRGNPTLVASDDE